MGGEIPIAGAAVVALAAGGIIAVAFRRWLVTRWARAHGCHCTEHPTISQTRCLEVEADELWSFVQKKTNPHWLWLAIDKQTRQILAFYVGDRSRESAKQLWANIPAVYRENATFYTDHYAAYLDEIPSMQHKSITKHARKTNYIERFNNTLRQRISRLVRSTLAFSKKLDYHIGAIRYFIGHYNLTRTALLV